MCDPKVFQSPSDSGHLAKHFQVNENHTTPSERLGAFMKAQGIEQKKITGDITTSTEAIQYIKQKMRSGEHWHSVNKWTGRVAAAFVAAGISVPISIATAGVGAALLIGAGASFIAAGTQDIAQSKVHKLALRHDWKLNPLRGIKALYKGKTKGKHRSQAAKILVDNARSYINAGMPKNHEGNPILHDGFLAHQALNEVYGDNVTINNVFRDNPTENIEKMVFELLRS